jgi:hypothetical protein
VLPDGCGYGVGALDSPLAGAATFRNCGIDRSSGMASFFAVALRAFGCGLMRLLSCLIALSAHPSGIFFNNGVQTDAIKEGAALIG